MDNLFLTPFVVSFSLAVVFLFGIIKIVKGQHFNSRTSLRHLHQQGILRLGGVAIISAFVITLFVDSNLIISKQLTGVLFACGAILLVGLWDDFRELSWQWQLLFQFALASFVFASGIRLEYLTNPLGGVFFLNGNVGMLLNFLIVVAWLLLIINAMNWADGIDGVSGGISVIGALAIFLVSLRPEVNQPPVAIIAMALLGALLAFLFFNFNPAKILAGTSGSLFMGFILAMLALFAGAKIATTLLVLAIPVLDASWVILARFRAGRSVFKADQRHLHHRLLALGWSQRKICFFYWSVTGLIAILALSVGALGKMLVFGIVILLMFLISGFLQKKKFSKLMIFGLSLFLVLTGTLVGFEKLQDQKSSKTLEIKQHFFQVEMVSTQAAKERGLGGRASLCDNCGMLFLFDQPAKYAFWMKDMQFALDILWLRDEKIIFIEKNISPTFSGTIVPTENADQVLEINAGKVAEWGISVGDLVKAH